MRVVCVCVFIVVYSRIKNKMPKTVLKNIILGHFILNTTLFICKNKSFVVFNYLSYLVSKEKSPAVTTVRKQLKKVAGFLIVCQKDDVFFHFGM